MAVEISSSVLSSLTASLNNTVQFAHKQGPVYTKELHKSFEILDTCYAIPTELLAVTKYQIDSLKNILNGAFSIKQTTGLNKEIDETENQVFNIFREFERYKNTYSNISKNILEKLASIQDIHAIIEKMKNIAREIKLFSINSVIVASQAGSQGIAFKSISRFIIELSDSIQKSAFQMENYRDKILHTHKRMEELFNKLIYDIYEKKTVEVKKQFLSHIKNIKSKFTFISIIIDDVDKRILQTLQESQTIFRQYKPGSRQIPILSYWANAVSMMSELQSKSIDNDTPEEILITIGYTYHMLNSLSKKMINHDVVLDTFVSRVNAIYETLVNKFGAAQQDSMYILNYISIPSGEVPSLLDRIFENFKEILSELKELLDEEDAVKVELIHTFGEMQKIHNEGLGFFSSFEKFYIIMNNINVLAQIEMSKRDFDGGGNTNLKMQFMTMLDQLKVFNDEVKNSIQKMLMSLTNHMSSFSDTQIEESSFLVDTQSFLMTQEDRLAYMKKEAHSIVDSIREENGKIFSVENQAKGHLNKFGLQAQSFLRANSDYYDGVMQNLGRFNGLLNYYNVSIRDYLVNNPFIQNFERVQSRV